MTLPSSAAAEPEAAGPQSRRRASKARVTKSMGGAPVWGLRAASISTVEDAVQEAVLLVLGRTRLRGVVVVHRLLFLLVLVVEEAADQATN